MPITDRLTGRRTPDWWLRFYAQRLAGSMAGYDELLAPRKRALLGGLQGTIAEIGPGTGPNLAYYAAGINWVGVEPNRHMHPYLQAAVARYSLSGSIRHGSAEQTGLPDQSADAVVSTLVLCSVNDLAVVFQEIRRILRPGGQFVFIEHVAAQSGTSLRLAQRLITPLWSRLADGCHLDRETWHAIEQAGFRDVQIEHFNVPIWPASPQIAGVAIK